MVKMDSKDLLTEVSMFLGVTLAHERLSSAAEAERVRLLKRLSGREGSPQAYIDMNKSSICNQSLQHQISDCYEEFDNSFDSPKYHQTKDGYTNKEYNNLSSNNQENIYANNEDDNENYINIKNSAPFEDGTYIKPTSPLANTPVITMRPSLPPSNPNSQRNSIISLKKDSPERLSDCSSYTSSSTRCDESPEVLAMSASALRYAASKCGTLGRREKVLFVDHTKLYWVAVLNQTLFVFKTEKDSKPVSEVDISGYQARPVAIATNNNFRFELVCPGKKTHQFVAEKQADMEKWITALNTASKTTDHPREWLRQLPSLPPPHPALETYDQPDSALRPVEEAEYELPDVLMKNSHNHCQDRKLPNQMASSDSNQSSKPSKDRSPKEMRRLPSLPHQETYDQPELPLRPVQPQPELYECLREDLYHCIEEQAPNDPSRRLPLLPQELEMYDLPDSCPRPVSSLQGRLYTNVDTAADPRNLPSCEAVYNNVPDESESSDQEEDCNYYNLVPSFPEKETDQECIYDVITEHRQLKNPSPNPTPTSLSIKTHSDSKENDENKKNDSNQNTIKIKKINSIQTDLKRNDQKKSDIIKTDSKKPEISVKPDVISVLTNEIRQKFEDKKNSPIVTNVATIFNKPFSKPQLKEVKPPFIQKIYQ